MTDYEPEVEADGYTAEECPAWGHDEEPGFDQYVVCLRCDHYEDDCPHECGPEFSHDDVAYCLEQRAAAITRLTAERDALQSAAETLTFLWVFDYRFFPNHPEYAAYQDAQKVLVELLDALAALKPDKEEK
jgi:hypothetical protein